MMLLFLFGEIPTFKVDGKRIDEAFIDVVTVMIVESEGNWLNILSGGLL